MLQLSRNRIAICAALAAIFLGVQPNTINTNLRQHAFKFQGRLKVEPDLPETLRGCDGRGWSVWNNLVVPFTQWATDSEIADLVDYARHHRGPKHLNEHWGPWAELWGPFE
jgi:hypothetical protein